MSGVRYSRPIGLAAVLALATASCSNGQDPSSALVWAQAQGSVRTEAGQPVEGALVHVTTRVTVASGSTGFTDDSVRTDGSGRFAIEMAASGSPPRESDVRVAVTPPAGASLAPRVVEGITVYFDTLSPPADTVDVAVRLAPQP